MPIADLRRIVPGYDMWLAKARAAYPERRLPKFATVSTWPILHFPIDWLAYLARSYPDGFSLPNDGNPELSRIPVARGWKMQCRVEARHDEWSATIAWGAVAARLVCNAKFANADVSSAYQLETTPTLARADAVQAIVGGSEWVVMHSTSLSTPATKFGYEGNFDPIFLEVEGEGDHE